MSPQVSQGHHPHPSTPHPPIHACCITNQAASHSSQSCLALAHREGHTADGEGACPGRNDPLSEISLLSSLSLLCLLLQRPELWEGQPHSRLWPEQITWTRCWVIIISSSVERSSICAAMGHGYSVYPKYSRPRWGSNMSFRNSPSPVTWLDIPPAPGDYCAEPCPCVVMDTARSRLWNPPLRWLWAPFRGCEAPRVPCVKLCVKDSFYNEGISVHVLQTWVGRGPSPWGAALSPWGAGTHCPWWPVSTTGLPQTPPGFSCPESLCHDLSTARPALFCLMAPRQVFSAFPPWPSLPSNEFFLILIFFLTFLCFLKMFYWSTVDLKYHVSFRYAAKWFIYIYIYILFHILFRYRLLHDIECSSLFYTVGPCCLSILYIVVCVC